MKKAFITGISGQDGSYLAENLINHGYSVYGLIRRQSVSENQTYRLNHIFDDVKLFYGDMTDLSSLFGIIKKVEPDIIFNLAAQSHVRISFDMPIFTAQTNAIGMINLLEAVRIINHNIRVYQASSSEMFGNNCDPDGFQRETTTMNPVSPYGCSKLFAYNLCKNYRNSYDMFITNGILFNHESPRRGENFVTNKVAKIAVEIKKEKKNFLSLGNLKATRDWGHAKDYVDAMRRIMELDAPDDFVCASGKSHSVKDLCKYVFEKLGMDYKSHILVDEKYFRPEELNDLKGDCSKLKKATDWQPKYTFESMLDEMVDYWMNK